MRKPRAWMCFVCNDGLNRVTESESEMRKWDSTNGRVIPLYEAPEGVESVCPTCGEFSNTAKDQRIKALEDLLRLAIRQNEHDMVMTGDELRKCRVALQLHPTSNSAV